MTGIGNALVGTGRRLGGLGNRVRLVCSTPGQAGTRQSIRISYRPLQTPRTGQLRRITISPIAPHWPRQGPPCVHPLHWNGDVTLRCCWPLAVPALISAAGAGLAAE